MCGRYTVIKYDQITRVFFNITIPANLRLIARFNIAPTQWVPVITNQARELQLFRWGMIPSWAKDETIGNKLINARAESLAEKPSFRTALSRRRCLIPADGFYEWRKGPGVKGKTPMYVTVNGGGLFCFAGLWDRWENPGGEAIQSFTIITTSPNELMRGIHDRMPVILPEESWETWLSPTEKSAEELLPLLGPYRGGSMAARAVGPRINSPRNEGPELLSEGPVAEQGLLF